VGGLDRRVSAKQQVQGIEDAMNEFSISWKNHAENTNYSDNALPRCNSYSHHILNELNEILENSWKYRIK
jgi:hypothetical protein